MNYRRVDGRKQAEGNSRRIPVGLPYPYSRPIVRRVINAARSGGRLIDGSQKPVAAWHGAGGERGEYGEREGNGEKGEREGEGGSRDEMEREKREGNGETRRARNTEGRWLGGRRWSGITE